MNQIWRFLILAISLSYFSDANLFAQNSDKPVVAIDDFQVNEAGGPLGAHQLQSSIAGDSNSFRVVAWRDKRNDIDEIYAQIFDSTNKIGTNFKVSDSNHTNNNSPCVTVSNNEFIIVWEAREGFPYSILAQRFEKNGTPIGQKIQINSALITDGSAPQIEVFEDGGFVVTWHGSRSGIIYMQLLDKNGSKIGSNTAINTIDNDGGYPKVGVAASGNFIITWEGWQENNKYLYAQQFSKSGEAQDTNIVLYNSSDFGGHDLGVNSQGDFICCWVERQIYIQKFDIVCNPVGSMLKVNDSSETATQSLPEIHLNDAGDFFVTWQDRRNNNLQIYGQRFSSQGERVSLNIAIDDNLNNLQQTDPSLYVDKFGDYCISWTDLRSGNQDVYVRSFENSDNPINPSERVNDDVGSAEQSDPVIGVDNNGNFITVWTDERNDPGDIYLQRYNKDGSLLSTNTKINDDSTSTKQFNVALDVDSMGNFVAVWEDERNGKSEIFAQLFNYTGTKIGKNFKVNQNTDSYKYRDPAIAIVESGEIFVICWIDDQYNHQNIHAQIFDKNGEKIDSIIHVSSSVDVTMNSPRVDINMSGDFVIAWREQHYPSFHIYKRRFKQTGIPIEEASRVNINSIIFDSIGNLDTKFGNSGKYIVVWYQYEGNGDITNIYGQQYDSMGGEIGSNFKINKADNEDVAAGSLNLSVNKTGSFVVTWGRYYSGVKKKIYAHAYNRDGIEQGEIFEISASENQEEGYIVFKGSKIYNIWSDDKENGVAKDIWSNVLDLERFILSTNKDDKILPLSIILHQNYPNPFNPSTTISFELPKRSKVKLEIFNVKGQKVKTIFNGFKNFGKHEVVFNSETLSTGLYFCRLTTENNIDVKKMFLIK